MLILCAFSATFVESFSTFWVKLASAPIWDGVSPRPIVTEPSAPTDPPPIAAVSVTGCESTKSCYHDCSVRMTFYAVSVSIKI